MTTLSLSLCLSLSFWVLPSMPEQHSLSQKMRKTLYTLFSSQPFVRTTTFYLRWMKRSDPTTHTHTLTEEGKSLVGPTHLSNSSPVLLSLSDPSLLLHSSYTYMSEFHPWHKHRTYMMMMMIKVDIEWQYMGGSRQRQQTTHIISNNGGGSLRKEKSFREACGVMQIGIWHSCSYIHICICICRNEWADITFIIGPMLAYFYVDDGHIHYTYVYV